MCAALLALSACTSGPAGRTASAVPPAGVGHVAVTGLPAGRSAEISDHGTQPAPATGLPFLSDVYYLGPSGPLGGTAHVTLPLRSPAPAGAAVVAATHEDPSAPWQYVSATLSADRRSASFDTTHFSLFGILGYDLGQLAETFKTDFIDGLDASATQTDLPKPTCDSEAAARGSGYHITSSTTDTVYWCLGLDDTGRRVLKLINHRRYPLQVLHPHMTTVANPHDYLALASLSRFSSGPYAIVAPGATAIFDADLVPGGSGGIHTEMDGLGQSLYALQTAVETLSSILTRFGAGSGKTAVKVMDSILSDRSCSDSLDKGGGAYIAGCFSPDQIITAFGAKAVLIVPLMIFGPVLSFLHSEWNALVDQFNNHDQYRITITRYSSNSTDNPTWVTVDDVTLDRLDAPGGQLQAKLVGVQSQQLYQGGPSALLVAVQVRSTAPGSSTYSDTQAMDSSAPGSVYVGVRGLPASDCAAQVDGYCMVATLEQTDTASGDCQAAGPNGNGNTWLFLGPTCAVSIGVLTSVVVRTLQPSEAVVFWRTYSQPYKYVRLS